MEGTTYLEPQDHLPELVAAFQLARKRASSAIVVEETLRQLAITEAKRTGMTIRKAAELLDLTRTGVSRQWNETPCSKLETPPHGSIEEVKQASSSAWSQNPELEHQLMPKLTEN